MLNEPVPPCHHEEFIDSCPVCWEQYYDQLRTQMDAWHRVFETSQLTHAKARLVAAEDRVKRMQRAIQALRDERDVAVHIPVRLYVNLLEAAR